MKKAPTAQMVIAAYEELCWSPKPGTTYNHQPDRPAGCAIGVLRALGESGGDHERFEASLNVPTSVEWFTATYGIPAVAFALGFDAGFKGLGPQVGAPMETQRLGYGIGEAVREHFAEHGARRRIAAVA